MRDTDQLEPERSPAGAVPALQEIDLAVNELCEQALRDARGHLHPLVQNSELSRLDKRVEFIQALKSGLEQRLARRLAVWQPDVQAVFKYEETPTQSLETWDGAIHLLVKVPRLSDAVKMLGKILDDALVHSLRRLGLPRFQGCQSVLEVQQITPSELRHGIGYGAMFCAVYTAPVMVWPQERHT
jgi:hypothetical protein